VIRASLRSSVVPRGPALKSAVSSISTVSVPGKEFSESRSELLSAKGGKQLMSANVIFKARSV
jgi:hypothetical protein